MVTFTQVQLGYFQVNQKFNHGLKYKSVPPVKRGQTLRDFLTVASYHQLASTFVPGMVLRNLYRFSYKI